MMKPELVRWLPAVMGLLVGLGGCTQVTNALIPPHPASLQTNHSDTRLELLDRHAVNAKDFVPAFDPPVVVQVDSGAQTALATGTLVYPPRAATHPPPDALAKPAKLLEQKEKDWLAEMRAYCGGDVDCRAYERARRRHLQARAAACSCVGVADPETGVTERAVAPAFAAGLVDIAAGALVSAAESAIKREAAQYESTYSDRASGLLMKAQTGGSTNAVPGFSCIRLTRTARIDGPERKAFELWVHLDFEPEVEEAFRLSPMLVRLDASASKVTALSADRWWGYLLPWMWGHAIWAAFDHDLYKVDLQATLQLDAVETTRDGRALERLGESVFHLGKVDVRELPAIRVGEELAKEESGYLPVPLVLEGSSRHPEVPANVVMTIAESNDLGDVIGQAAGTVKDQKKSLAKQAKKWLGIKTEYKTDTEDGDSKQD